MADFILLRWYFMSWKNYFSFNRRVNRREYFRVFFLLSLFFNNISPITMSLKGILLLTICIVFSIVGICFTVQRFHDLERPSVYLLFLLIPFVNLYLTIILLFRKGTDGPNRYGKDPLDFNIE